MREAKVKWELKAAPGEVDDACCWRKEEHNYRSGNAQGRERSSLGSGAARKRQKVLVFCFSTGLAWLSPPHACALPSRAVWRAFRALKMLPHFPHAPHLWPQPKARKGVVFPYCFLLRPSLLGRKPCDTPSPSSPIQIKTAPLGWLVFQQPLLW